jgi:hypothetical protein
MSLPDEILTNILSYLPYFELDKYLAILRVDTNKRQKIKKPIHDQRLTKKVSSQGEEYSIEGFKHNEYGPAVINYGDTGYLTPLGRGVCSKFILLDIDNKEYWIKGKLHNDSGPAIVHANGCLEYWRNGQLHNDAGPALIYSLGSYRGWFLFNERVSPFEVKK